VQLVHTALFVGLQRAQFEAAAQDVQVWFTLMLVLLTARMVPKGQAWQFAAELQSVELTQLPETRL
jgi:predicted branched-subunit amino acid permease